MDFKTGSGDLTADRRFEMARQFAARGDSEAAADLMTQAVEIAPGWAAGWFELGRMQVAAGQPDSAAAAFRRCLTLEPEDRLGAALELSLLGHTAGNGMTPGGRLPDAYVRALFDDYAPRFDDALSRRLLYRAPDIARRTVDALVPKRVGAILDLGCGTGLSGEAFRDKGDRLDGVDLSPGMIGEARKKAIYDTLAVNDIERFLDACTDAYDLILAIDVLIYTGGLNDVLAKTHRILKRDGLFCFTLQAYDGPGYVLGPDHRYSYSEAYLRESAGDWTIAALEPCVLRQDAGFDVPGFVCALR